MVVRHRNVLAAIKGTALSISPDDVYLAYLPLAHILELVVECAVLGYGGCVAYARGPRTLVEDMQAIRPTVMAGVPKVYDTIAKRVRERVPGWLAWPLRAGLLSWPLNRRVLGGRMRLMVSGGGALSEETHASLRGAFRGVDVVQGYGLTETCGGGTLQPAGDAQVGVIGRASACNEVRLASDPDGYLEQDLAGRGGLPVLGRGEVLIRGDNVATCRRLFPRRRRLVPHGRHRPAGARRAHVPHRGPQEEPGQDPTRRVRGAGAP